MRECPFCAEQIQDAATLCRYCNQRVARNTKRPVENSLEERLPSGISMMPVPEKRVDVAMQVCLIFTWPLALGWSWFYSETMYMRFIDVLIPGGFFFGLILSMFFGLIWSNELKGVRVTLEIVNENQFLDAVTFKMNGLGYSQISRHSNFVEFKKSGLLPRFLKISTISMEMVEAKATIVGPKAFVEKLTKTSQAR